LSEDGDVSQAGRATVVLGRRDALMSELDTAVIRYREAMLEADRASTRLTDALLRLDALNQARSRTVSDQELTDRVNAHIPDGARALNRRLRMSLMTIRRRLGKAPGK